MAVSFNARVNAKIIETVAYKPGITLRELEVAVRCAIESNRQSGNYFMGGGYFYQRVERMVKRGKLRKLVYKADGLHQSVCGHYFTPDKIPTAFDLSKDIDRLVAADYVQDGGDEETGNSLRRAKRGN